MPVSASYRGARPEPMAGIVHTCGLMCGPPGSGKDGLAPCPPPSLLLPPHHPHSTARQPAPTRARDECGSCSRPVSTPALALPPLLLLRRRPPFLFATGNKFDCFCRRPLSPWEYPSKALPFRSGREGDGDLQRYLPFRTKQRFSACRLSLRSPLWRSVQRLWTLRGGVDTQTHV